MTKPPLYRCSPPIARLSFMMFLQFFVLGSTMPIMSLYFKSDLEFSGIQTGIILAASAFSSLVSPVIGAVLADRMISAERLLSVFHAAGALLLFGLSRQNSFFTVLVFYLCYWLVIGPTTALTTTITLHHEPEGVKKFGGIRLWGTLGWIAAAWVYRLLFINRTDTPSAALPAALQLGVWSALLLSVFALILPRGAVPADRPPVLFPRESFRIIMLRPVLVLSVFAVVISIADRMYVYGGAPYLKSLGYNEMSIMPLLSIGQIPEIAGLALLGLMITRLGMKKVILLGTVLEILRFSLFTLRTGGVLLYIGISFHGLTYAFFSIAASLFLDNQCTRTTRSGVHQYFALFVGGVSTLFGNILSGAAAELTTSVATGHIMFRRFWLVPLLFSIAGCAGVLIFFKPERQSTSTYR